MTRDPSRSLDSERLRTDGGERNSEPSDGDVLAVLESVAVRTYDSKEAVPDSIVAEKEIASPADIGFDITVETVTGTATTRTPARISVRVEYVGDEPLPYSDNPRFARYFLSDFNSTTGLHLYPVEAWSRTSITPEDDRCWTVPPLGVSMSLQWGEIEPHTTAETEFDIVADPEKGVCYPRGEYEILQRYGLPEDPTVYWGLLIELSSP